MPVFTKNIELSEDFPTIRPTLNLNFTGARALDPRVTFARASIGTYVGSDGLIKTAGNNEARFDHDPETLESLGLLIEESRTNNALYSDDFSNSAWAKQTGHGLTSNTTLAPDGTQNADTFNRGASNQYIFQSIGVTGTHTLSVWVKTPSGDGNHNFVMQHFNGVDGGLGATTFTATEEWQRFSIQASPTVGGGWYPCIPSTLSQDYHVWGAQVEAGSFPTSYIPTSGAALTRNDDIGSIIGDDFTSFFNQSEGTFDVGYRLGENNVAMRLCQITNGSASTIIDLVAGSGSGLGGYWFIKTGTNQFSQPTIDNSTQVDRNFRCVLAYKENDCVAQNNKTPAGPTTDTSVTLASNYDQLLFYQIANGGDVLQGHIKFIRYYPKRLTDAQVTLFSQD